MRIPCIRERAGRGGGCQAAHGTNQVAVRGVQERGGRVACTTPATLLPRGSLPHGSVQDRKAALAQVNPPFPSVFQICPSGVSPLPALCHS